MSEQHWTYFCACWFVIGSTELQRTIDQSAVVDFVCTSSWEWSLEDGLCGRDYDEN